MIKPITYRIYKTFRQAGYQAHHAIHAAKTQREWESHGDNVRLRAEPEEENYFDAYGRECLSKKDDAQIEQSIENFGLWRVVAEYRCHTCGQWEHGDSIGMIIADDPLNPLENCYIPDLQGNTLDERLKQLA